MTKKIIKFFGLFIRKRKFLENGQGEKNKQRWWKEILLDIRTVKESEAAKKVRGLLPMTPVGK